MSRPRDASIGAIPGAASGARVDDGNDRGALEGLDFASVLAISVHDMKNSVATIVAGLNACLGATDGEGALDPLSLEGQTQRAMLLQEAYRLNASLVELLTLFRAQQGLEHLQPTTFDVLEWLEDRVAALLPAAEHAGIAFELEIGPDRLSGGANGAVANAWHVRWDARLLGVVIDNVLTNTLRHARRRIRLRVERVGDHWRDSDAAGGAPDRAKHDRQAASAAHWLRVTIEDDGDGYPSARLGRLPVAPRPGDLRNADRTGLGLYFAARIVDLHRDAEQRPGWIEIHNGAAPGAASDTAADHDAPGGGRFTMCLPARALGPTD